MASPCHEYVAEQNDELVVYQWYESSKKYVRHQSLLWLFQLRLRTHEMHLHLRFPHAHHQSLNPIDQLQQPFDKAHEEKFQPHPIH